VHNEATVTRALELIAQGQSSRSIAAELAISASTVRVWRAGAIPGRTVRTRRPAIDPEQVRMPQYAYLLGLYLGDGWLVSMRERTYSLRLALDQRYPQIIRAAADAMAAMHPRGRVRVVARQGCAVVSSYWIDWPILFPQHGPGPKHTRPIVLANWQQETARQYPRELIRGLLHSDGCRFVARQRVGPKIYEYTRYAFTNRSEDIKGIFCAHLDQLGIEWTRPNAWHIAIDRRSEVAKLDAFVGPKR
jgi:hypothetical protein